MLNKKSIYAMGFHHGYSIAINSVFEEAEFKDLDYDAARDKYMQECGDAEENSREFTPFEFTARDLNDLIDVKPYDPWEVYDDAIYAGFTKGWREFLPVLTHLKHPVRRPRKVTYG
jgi:hypothetical protein